MENPGKLSSLAGQSPFFTGDIYILSSLNFFYCHVRFQVVYTSNQNWKKTNKSTKMAVGKVTFRT